MATKDRTSLKNDFANGKYATGEKFADLIDSMKVVQLPVVDPQALGASLSFIDSISQDADGKITATKKTLDLANAHELNPFKGWYKTGDTLPTDGFDGAYLYFKDTSELTGQTTIYRWNGTAYADTGTVVDTSNVQTFETGQAVNAVAIDGTELKNPAGNALPKAEEVMQLAAKLAGVTAEEVKASYTVYHPTNYNDGYYKEVDGVVSWQNSPDTHQTGEIDVTGYKSARFWGFIKTINATPTVIVFLQKDANGNVLYYEHYKTDVNSAVGYMEYRTELVSGATKLYCVVSMSTGFYCYLQKGDAVQVPTTEMIVKKIDLSLYRFVYHGNKSNNQWGSTTNDKTTAIPVKEGDIVRFSVGTVGTSSVAYSGYAFMKDHTLNKYQPLGFADGFGVVPVTANTNYEVKVPKGCTNIVFFEQYSNTVLMQLSSVEVETVKEMQEEVQLVAVNAQKEESHVYHRNGEFVSSSLKSYFYEVSEDKAYCINMRVGYQGALNDPQDEMMYVTYLSATEEVLGFDNDLIAKGYNQYLRHRMLSLPAGTKYVVLIRGKVGVQFGLFKVLNDDDVVVDAINYVETLVSEPSYTTVDSNTEDVPASHLSGWGFRLPESYDKDADPFPVVAMLHGASGYVTPTVLGYDSTPWKTWQETYLANGFIVMDVNGYGIYDSDSDITHTHGGCPMAVQTVKKAFEYLKAHYNVADKIYLHGSSMGGALCFGYLAQYSNDVAKVALFAPWLPILRYMETLSNTDNKVAVAWGYTDGEEMRTDGMSHMNGYQPFFSCLKIKKSDNTASLNAVSQSFVEDFILDTDGIAGDSEYLYIEKCDVPLRIWIGTADTTVPPMFDKAVYNAYRNGNAQVTLRIIEGAQHDFCAGSVGYVFNEAARYFMESR